MLEYTLQNGIKVIAEQLNHLHTLSMGVWVAVGSGNELQSENGLSHFIEHMVFKGTQTRSAKDIAEEMDAIGANMNAFTSKSCTCFYVRTLDRDMYKGLEMLSDLIYKPKFDSIELEKERNVVLEEIAMSIDTPEDLLSDIAAESVHEGPLSKPILGTRDLIKSYMRDDLISYWSKHYTPNNIVISVVGNYNEKDLIDSINKLFSNCPNNDKLIASTNNSLKFCNSYINKHIEQDHILLSYPALAISHPLEYALNIFNTVLGGAMSSRIFQKIREEMGLAYSVYSYTNKYKELGTLCIYAGTNINSAQDAINSIINEIENIKTNGISKKEFDMSKAQIMSSLEFSMESTAARMSRLGKSILLENHAISQEEILKKIDSVSMKDIEEVIKLCFSRDPAISIVGPNAKEVLDKVQ